MKKCRKNYNRTSSNKETYRKDHGQWGNSFHPSDQREVTIGRTVKLK